MAGLPPNFSGDTTHSSMSEEKSTVPDVTGTDGKASAKARRAALARAASKRRRFVDPATCDRDYTQAELEFMNAIQAYKQKSGRMFPTWGEVLEVLRDLGYSKIDSVAGPS
jgi:hypothetical protein